MLASSYQNADTSSEVLLWIAADIFLEPHTIWTEYGLLHDTFATSIDLLAKHWTEFRGEGSVVSMKLTDL
jgi:hypothetical protein